MAANGRPGTGGPRRTLVEQEIYRHALSLFDTKGYESTTLKDIAELIGTSRSSLYYYFSTKEEILERLVEEITSEGARAIASIVSREESPVARITADVELMVSRRLDEPERFRVLDRCENQLPEELAERHKTSKRNVLASLSGVVDEGMRSGAFRPGDPRIAAFAILGMCNWVAWWYRPSSTVARQDIIDQLSRTALAGLANEVEPTVSTSAPEVIRVVRDQLDRLEMLIRTDE